MFLFFFLEGGGQTSKLLQREHYQSFFLWGAAFVSDQEINLGHPFPPSKKSETIHYMYISCYR